MARDRNGSAPWLLLNAMSADFRASLPERLVEGTASDQPLTPLPTCRQSRISEADKRLNDTLDKG